MKRAILLMAFLSASALADPQPWMVKKDPESLGLNVRSEGACPDFDLSQIVREVIEMAGVTTVQASESRDLYLVLHVRCATGGGNFEFDVDTDFGTTKYGPELYYVREHLSPYGSVNRRNLEQAIRDDVSAAINDYLEAQMRYGPVQ